MSIKHVLILSVLIIPLFILAPTVAPRMDRAQTNLTQVENFLPAQFAKETLRVAVYAEADTTLPSYATGGVYTSNYQNVINLLNSQGYATTALSTQDILDHKLMAASYDAFVLPDQLPKDNIVKLVKDYWLAGGGILCFESAVGYLFYEGMIHADFEGNFMLWDEFIHPEGLWAYRNYDGILTNSRHPVTKSLEDNTEYSFTENAVYLGGFDLVPRIGSRYIELAVFPTNPSWSSMFALDNPDKGGKIVFLPGNCSSFETWIRPVIADAVDWLAPRPKARIAFDFSKTPYYGVDSWDKNVSVVPRYNIWRDFLVNHSYTVDKLYPPIEGALTSSILAPFDMLIISLPKSNYSAFEITNVIRPFVANGGGLFYLTDYYGINTEGHENMNELISPWGFSVTNHVDMGSFYTSEFDDHVILEGINSVYMSGGEWVNITGDAYPIVRQGSNIAVAGCDVGQGRVIVSGDVNFLDKDRISNADNIQFAKNVINWLSTGKADVLVYTDGGSLIDPEFNYYRSSIANALNGLGISFYMTNNVNYFNLSLGSRSWKLVISDANSVAPLLAHESIIQHLESGGKLIMRDFMFRYTGHSLWNYIGWEGNQTTITAGPPSVHIWNAVHPIFNLPAEYGASNINSSSNYFNTDFTHVMLFDNATALAGITLTPEENMSAIVLGAGGRAICNMFAISEYDGDTDDSTYPDNFEILTNEIGYLYFSRPTIDHPADVTYMETETGNEIIWNPTGGAGPWQYVLSVNGTSGTPVHWTGGAITVNIDGINRSITEFELTVYDRLGYSATDIVILNVTEYIPTTGGGGLPIDPMLLALLGVGMAAVIIIIVIVTRRGKK